MIDGWIRCDRCAALVPIRESMPGVFTAAHHCKPRAAEVLEIGRFSFSTPAPDFVFGDLPECAIQGLAE